MIIFIRKTIIIYTLVFLSLLILMNIYFNAKGFAFLYVMPYMLIMPVIYILSKQVNIKHKHYRAALFALAFVSKALAAFLLDTPPSSDFELFYNAAAKASNGDFSFTTNGYFNVWGYQTGIVLFYASIIKIFGKALMPIKIINCLFMAGVNLLVYLISRNIASEKTSRFISLIYLIYPAPYFLASVLTNQHISNFFLYAGIYVYMIKGTKNMRNILLAAFLFALGNAMRPQAIVIIASIAVFGLIEQIKAKYDQKEANFRSIIFLVVFYFLIGQFFSQVIKMTGINQNGLENTFPQYKFVVGLNYDTKGGYSACDAKTLISIADKNERKNKSIEIIKNRLSDPAKLLELLLYKQKIMWCDLDSTFGWGFYHLEKDGITMFGKHIPYSTFRDIVQKLEKQVYILVFIFAALGIYSILDKQKHNRNIFLLTLLISANFTIYCLIEISSRYRDFTMIAAFIVASAGFEFAQMKILKKTQARAGSNLLPALHASDERESA